MMAGAKPAYSSSRPVRPAPGCDVSPPGAGATVVSSATANLRSEHLVERVGDGLRVSGRALERHLLGLVRLVVEQRVGPLLLALVDQQRVRLLVEERPAVGDEVL